MSVSYETLRDELQSIKDNQNPSRAGVDARMGTIKVANHEDPMRFRQRLAAPEPRSSYSEQLHFGSDRDEEHAKYTAAAGRNLATGKGIQPAVLGPASVGAHLLKCSVCQVGCQDDATQVVTLAAAYRDACAHSRRLRVGAPPLSSERVVELLNGYVGSNELVVKFGKERNAANDLARAESILHHQEGFAAYVAIVKNMQHHPKLGYHQLACCGSRNCMIAAGILDVEKTARAVASKKLHLVDNPRNNVKTDTLQALSLAREYLLRTRKETLEWDVGFARTVADAVLYYGKLRDRRRENLTISMIIANHAEELRYPFYCQTSKDAFVLAMADAPTAHFWQWIYQHLVLCDDRQHVDWMRNCSYSSNQQVKTWSSQLEVYFDLEYPDAHSSAFAYMVMANFAMQSGVVPGTPLTDDVMDGLAREWRADRDGTRPYLPAEKRPLFRALPGTDTVAIEYKVNREVAAATDGSVEDSVYQGPYQWGKLVGAVIDTSKRIVFDFQGTQKAEGGDRFVSTRAMFPRSFRPSNKQLAIAANLVGRHSGAPPTCGSVIQKHNACEHTPADNMDSRPDYVRVVARYVAALMSFGMSMRWATVMTDSFVRKLDKGRSEDRRRLGATVVAAEFVEGLGVSTAARSMQRAAAGETSGFALLPMVQRANREVRGGFQEAPLVRGWESGIGRPDPKSMVLDGMRRERRGMLGADDCGAPLQDHDDALPLTVWRSGLMRSEAITSRAESTEVQLRRQRQMLANHRETYDGLLDEQVLEKEMTLSGYLRVGDQHRWDAFQMQRARERKRWWRATQDEDGRWCCRNPRCLEAVRTWDIHLKDDTCRCKGVFDCSFARWLEVRRIDCELLYPNQAAFREKVFEQLLSHAQRQIDLNERQVTTNVQNDGSELAARHFVDWTLYLEQLQRAISRVARRSRDEALPEDSLMREVRERVEFELRLASKPAPQRAANQRARWARTDGSIMTQCNTAAMSKLVKKGKRKAFFAKLEMGVEDDGEDSESDDDSEAEEEERQRQGEGGSPSRTREDEHGQEYMFDVVEAPEEREETPSRFLLETDRLLTNEELEAMRGGVERPMFRPVAKKGEKRAPRDAPRDAGEIVREAKRQALARPFQGLEGVDETVRYELLRDLEMYEHEQQQQQQEQQ